MYINENMIYITDKDDNVEIIDADWHDVYGLLVIQGNTNKLEIVINNNTVIPSIQIDNPIIRWIDSNQLILADARNEDGKNNLFILDMKGNIKHSFNCGDVVTDINNSKEGIWVSYFDEGIFGAGVSIEGLVLFNQDGTPTLKYNSYEKRNQRFLDCEAMCLGPSSSIWIYSQVNAKKYSLINLNHKNEILNIYSVPEILNQFNAISVREGVAYFFNNYKNELFSLDLRINKATKLGTLSGELRGINTSETNHFISIQSTNIQLITINP